MLPGQKLHHVGLRIADLDAAQNLWRDGKLRQLRWPKEVRRRDHRWRCCVEAYRFCEVTRCRPELFLEHPHLSLLLPPFRAVFSFRALMWSREELLDGDDGTGLLRGDVVILRLRTAATTSRRRLVADLTVVTFRSA